MELWIQLGVALGLGLLVGLQRERAEEIGPGIRTFPLITVFGSLCALLAATYSGWVLAAGLLALGALMVINNVNRRAAGEEEPGPTTETAALVMYGVGALVVSGQLALGMAAGGVVALLLHWKKPLHRFVERVGEGDLRAVFRLVLIGLVVLPVLPDRAFGPYGVLNPFRIWLMVVLIVGVSLGGYLASRFLGARAGSLLAGVLGGIISSTATTVSYARRTRVEGGASALAALVILIASTIVFARVILEVMLVAPSVLPVVLPQVLAMGVIMAVIATLAYLVMRPGAAEGTPGKDPSELGAAVFFGLLYGAVLFALAAAREQFGDQGLYVVAALSGLTDMDAITLSTAEMMVTGQVATEIGWRMILVGALSNILFKMAVVALLGSRMLMMRMALLFGLALAGGISLLWLWPSLGP